MFFFGKENSADLEDFQVIQSSHFIRQIVKFGRPDKLPEPTYGIGLSGWWIDPVKEKALATKIAQAAPADAAASTATSEAASTATSAATPADRGSSPISYVLYIGGAVILILIIGAMVKRKKAK